MERQRVSAVIACVVALGIVLAGMLGPLVLGVIRFRLPELLVNQYVGGEIVTMFVAAPALLVAALLWLRHDRLAPVIAIGPAAYTVYTFITAIVGQEYARYEGNAERAFPLYAVLIFGGTTLVILAGAEILHAEAPLPSDRLRRATSAVFLAIAAFFALAWSAHIAQVYRGDAPSEYVEGPTLFWLIKLMDLGFVLPAFTVAGIGLLRIHPAAIRLAYGMVCYAVCMAGAILGMAIAMVLKDDPAASSGMIAFLTPVTMLLAYLAWRLMRLYRHAGDSHELPLAAPLPLGKGHAG